ncbi:lutzicidin-like [Tiliqua scincoides]|uniref:lutzicidin-like n=1 Tax=Tiliqua scincoides TaxID=71010 RepID=UPI0034622D16
MKSCFWRLLLVAGAAAAAASNIAVPPPQKALSYEQAAKLALDLYNQKAGENFTFQLLKTTPQPEWDANSQSAQEVVFSIQETVCPAEEENLEQECEIKDDGLVKECSGYYFLDETPAVAVVACDVAKDEPQAKRVKRSKWKKFVKKVKKPFKSLLKHGSVVVGGSIPLAG